MKSCSRLLPLRTAAMFTLLLAVNADAAEEMFSVDLQAERKNVKVADPVWITVSATAPKGWEIELPSAPEAFEELKVIERVDRRQESDPDTFTATARFKLESLLPGRYQVGPLEVRFIPENRAGDSERSAETVLRSTESLTIHVQSSLGFFESRHLRDVYGTVSTPWTWRQWMVTAMLTVAVVAVAFVVYKTIDRWLQSQRINQRSLLQQLDQLDEARLNRSISNERLMLSVADVVRQSLRLAERTHPVYRTTAEWIDHFEKSARGVPSESDPRRLPDALKIVLREADAIKFAGKPATFDQARRSLTAARTIVRSFLQSGLLTEQEHDSEIPPSSPKPPARKSLPFRLISPRTGWRRGFGGRDRPGAKRDEAEDPNAERGDGS